MSKFGQNDESWRQTSGAYYDWQTTLKPERPYIHDYSQNLTMKLFMSAPEAQGSKVYCTFAQALHLIKDANNLTRGIPKIIYLVGWQYNGHDDKYPSWDEVNRSLKRDEDEDARDSYLWLCREARNYDTTVSVHVNMTDAYEDSPLWDCYLANNLISRNQDGSLKKIGNYNGKNAYQICYKHEWESRFTVKRIKRLIELLQLDQAGTVHLDAYFPRPNEYSCISQEEETSFMRRTIRYFRNNGIDVTSENFSHLRCDPLIGLQPWSWWFDQTSEEHFLQRPASLLSGAAIRDYAIPGFPVRSDLEFLFGSGMHGEDIFLDWERQLPRKDWHQLFIEQFCLRVLPYQYMNRFERLQLTGETENRIMHYSEGLTLQLEDVVMKQNGRILREGNDVLIPALWRPALELIGYSKSGYTRKEWSLPPEWTDISAVDVYRIEKEGLRVIARGRKVLGGKLELSLPPSTAVTVVPSGEHIESWELI